LLLPGRYEFTSYVTDSHHTVHYLGAGHLLLRSDFTCTGSDSVTSAALGTLRRGMVNVPAFGRAWWLPAACIPEEGRGATGRPALPRVLERAASKAADCS